MTNFERAKEIGNEIMSRRGEPFYADDGDLDDAQLIRDALDAAEKRGREELQAKLSETEAKLAAAWRCYHCSEVFTAEQEAKDHFAIEGVPPMCVDPLTKDEKARMVVVRKLEAELIKWRRENEQLDHDAGAYHAQSAELTRYFGQCGGVSVKTASQAYLVYEAMIGRAEAAEARLAEMEKVLEVSRDTIQQSADAMINHSCEIHPKQKNEVNWYELRCKQRTALAAIAKSRASGGEPAQTKENT